jgi:hypothetical protein
LGVALVTLHLILVQPLSGFAEETAFTYQGRLNDSTGPINGRYDFTFAIYDLPTGNGLFAIQTNLNTPVSNGLFTVTVDFGPVVTEAIFSGPQRWLEIDVRTNGGSGYGILSPRQRLTATPYAITAANVTGGLSGIFTNPVTFNNPANSFSGNGGGLTNVNAATLGGLGTNDFWRTKGNAGTTAGVNFLGTTDNQPLELQVNSTRALRIEPHATAAPSLVGGYYQNSVSGFHGAAIAGGGTSAAANAVSGDYAFIGAGYGAQAGNNSVVVAGAYNNAPGQYGFIGTGLNNTNLANYSFIGGGANHRIALNANNGFIGGGFHNFAGDGNTAIAGGANNIADVNAAGVGGGSENHAGADHAYVGGGQANNSTAAYATVGGGYFGNATGVGATIGGGGYDSVSALGNFANGNASFIGGGVGNTANGDHDVIGGGSVNTASGTRSVVAGGNGNTASADYSSIGGGAGNTIQASALGATIGGGTNNAVSGARAVVSGGDSNGGSGAYATVSGGGYNQATGRSSFVGGGGGRDSFGGGPYPNTASGDWSVLSGGWNNLASGYSSVVGGGGNNQATNTYATVPGGSQNVAGGIYAFAAGQQAQALHSGSFVWADSQAAAFSSTSNDEFCVRARGGIQLSPNTSVFCGNQTRQMLNLWGTQYGIGVQNLTTYFRCDNSAASAGYSWYKGGVHNDNQNNPGGGVEMMRLNGSGLTVNAITITGGADLAEPFEISASSNELPEGAVVVIDEENPGRLKLSDRAYDERVAGVLSGANGIKPGIQLRQQGVLEHGKNVALTGRVFVRVDTSNGSVKPGDLLTTSATPGYAMKVTNHARARGAILGKAMTGLNTGKGMVLVLVSLQ